MPGAPPSTDWRCAAALPGVVVGVGLILAWNQPFWPATPYGTWGILLLSYTRLLLPYPVRYVGAALAQIGPNLEAAARVHGASAARALRRIVLPLVLPALAASMLMVFAVASRELVTSLPLAPAGADGVDPCVAPVRTGFGGRRHGHGDGGRGGQPDADAGRERHQAARRGLGCARRRPMPGDRLQRALHHAVAALALGLVEAAVGHLDQVGARLVRRAARWPCPR